MNVVPKHCPNCGATGIECVDLESDDEHNPVFDCLCRSCGWSGDISPDIPSSGEWRGDETP